jgi:hypothetical protein
MLAVKVLTTEIINLVERAQEGGMEGVPEDTVEEIRTEKEALEEEEGRPILEF